MFNLNPHSSEKESKNQTISISILLILLSLLSKECTVSREALDSRIQRVEKGLIPEPETTIKTHSLSKANISVRMDIFKVSGVNIAVVNDNKIEWAKAYGVKDSGGNDPVTIETIAQAESISKPVAALLSNTDGNIFLRGEIEESCNVRSIIRVISNKMFYSSQEE